MGHRFMCKEYCDRILCISHKIMCSHTCGKRFVHEELLSDVLRLVMSTVIGDLFFEIGWWRVLLIGEGSIMTATYSTDPTGNIVQTASKYLAPKRKLAVRQQILVCDNVPVSYQPLTLPTNYTL